MLLKKIALVLVMLAVTAAPAFSWGAGDSGGADNKRVTVYVDGLACPFCTYNLEKRIKTLDAVADPLNWEASVEEGTARFDWKADVPFDEEAVREQIRKAGFTPGKIKVSETSQGNRVEKVDAEQNRSESDDDARAAVETLDAKAIERAAGVKATVQDDGVVRIAWSRDDVKVKVDGVDFPPSAGLGSWAAFKPAAGGEAIVMGDTVVFQDEVDAAMDAAFAHNLHVTALHNHFFFDEPRVFFMHIGGHGDPQQLALGVRAVWDAIKQVRADRAQPAEGFGGSTPAPGGKIDAEAITRISGLPGSKHASGVVKVSVGREGKMHGENVGGSMGLGTWAAFTGNDDLASIDGDFIMTVGEVQPVMQALRKHDIHIVALHNHMIGEQPPFYFLHFWGKGSTEELARGFRAALDAQKDTQ